MSHSPIELIQSRRSFLRNSAIGIGALALSGLAGTFGGLLLFSNDATAMTVNRSMNLLTNLNTDTSVYIGDLRLSNASIDLGGHGSQLAIENFSKATAQTQYHGPGKGIITQQTSGTLELGSRGSTSDYAFRVRWTKVGKDADGSDIDVEMTVSYLKVEHWEGRRVWLFSMSDDAKPQFQSYGYRGSEIGSDWDTYPGHSVVEMQCDFRIYKTGTTTKSNHSTLFVMSDLDGKEERVRLGNGFQSPVYVRNDTMLTVANDGTFFYTDRDRYPDYNADDTSNYDQSMTGLAVRSLPTGEFSVTWYGWSCHTRLDLDYLGDGYPDFTVSKSPANQTTKPADTVAFDVTVNKLSYTVAANRPKSITFTDQLHASIDPSSVTCSVYKGDTDVTGQWTKNVSSSGLLTMTAKTTDASASSGIYGQLRFHIEGKQKAANAYAYTALPKETYNGKTHGKYTNMGSITVVQKNDGPLKKDSNSVNVYVLLNGYLKLKKASADAEWTSSHTSTYSLEGAEYTVTNSSGSVVGKLTTIADGTTNTLELAPGTYTVKETKPAKNFKLDTKTYTVVIEPDKTSTVDSAEPLEHGGVGLQKKDADMQS